MCEVVAQVACELQRGRRALHENDTDVSRIPAHTVSHALVDQGLPHPVLAPAVEDVDALDPRGRGRGDIVDQQRLEPREQPACVGTRCARGVGEDVERRAAETRRHAGDEAFHPRFGGGDPQSSLDADLQGVAIAPQQRDGGVEAGRDLRTQRRHPSILGMITWRGVPGGRSVEKIGRPRGLCRRGVGPGPGT
ncbi:hypothetical protein ASD43_08945 [Microbacterium sp. Root553]|nr:hypothetical protein ASD43_08945 [Microbacterium sp. Root553]